MRRGLFIKFLFPVCMVLLFSSVICEEKKAFSSAQFDENLPREKWHIRKSKVGAKGLTYQTNSKKQEMGICYRDLSRKKVGLIKPKGPKAGLDLGLYFNEGGFSAGIYSGVHFQKLVALDETDFSRVRAFKGKKPYAGIELAFKF